MYIGALSDISGCCPVVVTLSQQVLVTLNCDTVDRGVLVQLSVTLAKNWDKLEKVKLGKEAKSKLVVPSAIRYF